MSVPPQKQFLFRTAGGARGFCCIHFVYVDWGQLLVMELVCGLFLFRNRAVQSLSGHVAPALNTHHAILGDVRKPGAAPLVQIFISLLVEGVNFVLQRFIPPSARHQTQVVLLYRPKHRKTKTHLSSFNNTNIRRLFKMTHQHFLLCLCLW